MQPDRPNESISTLQSSLLQLLTEPTLEMRKEAAEALASASFLDVCVALNSFVQSPEGRASMLGIRLDRSILEKVRNEAKRVLGTDEAADQWLTQTGPSWHSPPCCFLNSKKGVDRVMEALGRIEHGVYS